MKIGSRKNSKRGEKSRYPKIPALIMCKKEYKYLIGLTILLTFLQNPNQTIVQLFASQTSVHWNIIYQALTSLFLHYNIMHLLVNLTILFSVTIIANVNNVKTTYIIPKMLIIGYFANLTAITLSYGYNLPNTIIIGLSGGILGFVGITISKLLLNITKNNLTKTIISLSIIAVLLYSLISSNILSNILHISGLSFGIITGIGSSFNNPNEKDPE